jgi:hypothetical protein
LQEADGRGCALQNGTDSAGHGRFAAEIPWVTSE